MRRKGRLAGYRSFSDEFRIPSVEFQQTGAFDLIINLDSALMIDPKLLNKTTAKELQGSYELVLSRFRNIFNNLEKCVVEGDRFWRAAHVLTDFSEFKGVSLGYSAESHNGKGWASTLRLQILKSAREVATAGLLDPEFFELLAIFQPGIGADRISDMIGTILLTPLCKYTKRICRDLNVETRLFTIRGKSYSLPWFKDRTSNDQYMILVPRDILSYLPVALNRGDIANMVAKNSALRQYLNNNIGKDWKKQVTSRGGKSVTRTALFKDVNGFREVIARYRKANATPYDFTTDSEELVTWYRCARQALKAEKLKTTLADNPTLTELKSAALRIVSYFKRSVEENRLGDVHLSRNAHHGEKTLQAALFAIAKAHCEQNKLPVSLSFNKLRGSIVFAAEQSERRVLITLKLTSSTMLNKLFDKQLDDCKRDKGNAKAMFVVVHVRNTVVNVKRLQEHIAKISTSNYKPDLIVIMGHAEPEPSKVARRQR